MSFYVTLKGKVNGRNSLMEYYKFISERGLENVQYTNGGWVDQNIFTMLPHFKFEIEEDALAFALATGGELSRGVPFDDKD